MCLASIFESSVPSKLLTMNPRHCVGEGKSAQYTSHLYLRIPILWLLSMANVRQAAESDPEYLWPL